MLVGQIYHLIYTATNKALRFKEEHCVANNHAANSIIGYMQSLGERAQNDHWNLNNYNRVKECPQSLISKFFFERILRINEMGFTQKPQLIGIDVLWIGARTTANPFAVQEIADALKGVDIPILIKNPVNPDLELWIGAFERINNAGLKQLGAIHRGFSSYDKKIYRNLPQWHIPIELRRRIPELPIFCDPSHIGGKRELVAPLCQQAMDLGFDGLIVESHCNPDCAWSDAAQQVTPDVLDYILNLLVIRKETQTTENLGELRNQIDDCDNEIIEVLAKRMRVCREIGTFKKEHDMTILQTGRYNEILDKRGAQGSLCGMDSEFIKKVFEAIHEESVRQQMEIINK
jgi:chorismate mutase